MTNPHAETIKTYRPIEALIPAHWRRSQYSAGDGAALAFYDTGGAKPALILLHGFQSAGLMWLRTAEALDAKYRVLMPDFRGHGYSRPVCVAAGGLHQRHRGDDRRRARVAWLGDQAQVAMNLLERKNRHFDALFANPRLMWLGQNTNHFPTHPAVVEAMLASIAPRKPRLRAADRASRNSAG